MDTRGAIRLDGVGKSYAIEGRPLSVLEGISLDIAAREFIAVVGASGCGKSTLLRLIAGLERADGGDIRIDGARVTGPGLDRSIVFQDPRLLPWLTVEDNVANALVARRVPARERRQAARQYLSLVGLAGFEQAHPAQLSGGMAQRAAIARALANDPDVLLMDEPLGAVDALTRLKLQNQLVRLWSERAKTIVLVTHDIEEAVFLADRVVVMDARPGRIRRIVPVPLPRPRDRNSAAFGEIRRSILADFIDDAG